MCRWLTGLFFPTNWVCLSLVLIWRCPWPSFSNVGVTVAQVKIPVVVKFLMAKASKPEKWVLRPCDPWTDPGRRSGHGQGMNGRGQRFLEVPCFPLPVYVNTTFLPALQLSSTFYWNICTGNSTYQNRRGPWGFKLSLTWARRPEAKSLQDSGGLLVPPASLPRGTAIPTHELASPVFLSLCNFEM